MGALHSAKLEGLSGFVSKNRPEDIRVDFSVEGMIAEEASSYREQTLSGRHSETNLHCMKDRAAGEPTIGLPNKELLDCNKLRAILDGSTNSILSAAAMNFGGSRVFSAPFAEASQAFLRAIENIARLEGGICQNDFVCIALLTRNSRKSLLEP
jgi:hypothetical protein